MFFFKIYSPLWQLGHQTIIKSALEKSRLITMSKKLWQLQGPALYFDSTSRQLDKNSTNKYMWLDIYTLQPETSKTKVIVLHSAFVPNPDRDCIIDSDVCSLETSTFQWLPFRSCNFPVISGNSLLFYYVGQKTIVTTLTTVTGFLTISLYIIISSLDSQELLH